MIILSPFSILINLAALWYILHLKQIGCECTLGTANDLIMYYLIISITCNFFLLYIFFNHRFKYETCETIYLAFFIPASIGYGYLTYQYVKKLKANNCECSNRVQRNILWIEALIISCIYCIGGLLMLKNPTKHVVIF